MKVRRIGSVALAALLAMSGALVSAAQADTTTVSLNGEFLSSLPPARTTGGSCNPNGTSTVSYTVSGPASGPYTGTFTETGTATFGPMDKPIPGAPGQFRAEMISFEADFTIQSQYGLVTGHKQLPAGAGSPDDVGNAASCFNDYAGRPIAQLLTSRLVYTAQTPFGDDSGTSWVNMNTYPEPSANSSSLQFREGFSSPNPVNPPPSGPSSVVLTPATDTNPVDTDHTVTATVRNSAGDPVANSKVLVHVSGAVTADRTCTTGTDGRCSVTYHGPSTPGSDTITGCADANSNGVADASEPCGTATKAWVGPDKVTVTPADATNPVGTSHTVTATATFPGGTAAPNQRILFDVSGASTKTGTCTTDANGRCDYAYTGPDTPGTDTITACADVNRNNTADPGEPCGTATKKWAGPDKVTVTPADATNPVGTSHTVTATATFPGGTAAPNQRILFDVSGASTKTGTCTTDANGRCDYAYTGPDTPGTDTITACADVNRNNTADPGEPCGTATKKWAGPDKVTVTPADATNPVGTSHTVTATATFPGGTAAPNQRILFDVSGASTKTGTCTTDANGRCDYAYVGPDLPGADMIRACVDSNRNGTVDAGEPCATATKAWVLPATTPGQVTGGGQVANAAGNDNLAFGFNAKSDSKGVKGECNVVDPSTGTKIKCLEVTTLVVSGTHATLFGRATYNSTPTNFRIDVDDVGEPGKGRDTFKIHLDNGYTVGGVLTGGNIQIH